MIFWSQFRCAKRAENFVHPGKEGPTALDGVSDVAWKENRDMSGELLSKVKRQNKIMIEFKGSSQITRTD